MSSNYPEKCHVAGCPCGYFNAKQPSESSATPKEDTGFLVPEAKNVSTRQESPGMTTCRDCDGSGTDGEIAGSCPYCGGSGEVETYDARQQRLTTPSAPTFTEEWESAPRWATRTTEIESAQYWFLRGGHAKEVELTGVINEDLREIRRIAGERLER